MACHRRVVDWFAPRPDARWDSDRQSLVPPEAVGPTAPPALPGRLRLLVLAPDSLLSSGNRIPQRGKPRLVRVGRLRCVRIALSRVTIGQLHYVRGFPRQHET